MEGILASLGVKLDVLAAQIINLLILFFAFKYFLGDKLSAALQERKEQMSKLKNAEGEYDRLMAEAQAAKDVVMAEALARKKEIIEEAKEIADVKVHEIIAQANHEAEQIKKESEHVYLDLHEELVNKFEDMVKQTAASGIKKLIGKRVELNQQYLEEITPKSS